jgi:anaerobilin synthase
MQSQPIFSGSSSSVAVSNQPNAPVQSVIKPVLSGSRDHWPYPAALAHTIKVYPIVQVAPNVGPQPISAWPPRLRPDVKEWLDQNVGLPSKQHLIYVHVPFCPFHCHFCPLFKTKKSSERTEDAKETFVEHLLTEIALYARIPSVRDRVYHGIYLGGGTPTELSPHQIVRILVALRKSFVIAPDAEVTLEGVAAQMLRPGYLSACVDAGVSRLSFGVQSLDSSVRRIIGRGDSIDDYPNVVTLAKSLRRDLVLNAELMAGLPTQTPKSLETDLRALVSWSLDSIDVFSYAMMPETPLFKAVALGRTPSPRYGAHLVTLRHLTNAVMESAGYRALTGEVFTKTDRDIFTDASFGGGGDAVNTVLGLGPSAFGLLNGVVYQNVSDLQLYGAAIESTTLPINTAQVLTRQTAERRCLILSLLRLEIPGFLNRRFGRLLAKWKARALLEPRGDGYRLTEKGQLWFNMMQLEVLPFGEMLRALPMFGSIDDLLSAARSNDLASDHYAELRALVASRGLQGRVRFMLYRLYLELSRAFRRDKSSIPFTGKVSRRPAWSAILSKRGPSGH